MTWFIKKSIPIRNKGQKTVVVPDGMWSKCPACQEIIYRAELNRKGNICPKCDYHFRLTPKERFDSLFDEGQYDYLFESIQPEDPLEFRGLKRYRDQLKAQQAKGRTHEAIQVARGQLDLRRVIMAVMDFDFLGGSMGSVVGEKLTRAIECAMSDRLPLIVFSCSGGARMMEGALSLMQMAKISAALARLADQHVPFISVLTDPTTGGVTASFAMLGDVNVAEPQALIGFAGPRVIQQTIRQELPPGFQRSEFLLRHGMLDAVIRRDEMRTKLSRYVRYFSGALD